MCGTQVNARGSSQGDIIDPETRGEITELADQLKVQCLREATMIPWRSTHGSAGYDISVTYSCVIPAKGKGAIQTRFAISLPQVYMLE